MSSIVVISILDESGEETSNAKLHVAYGNEVQTVTIFLSEPDGEYVDTTSREALNEFMAEQMSLMEGWDA